jgi:hypothetical protein
MPPPRFTSAKKQGEWAEQAFILEALGRDFTVLRPLGDDASYDVATGSPKRRRMVSVQVKSVSVAEPGGAYAVNCSRGSSQKTAYTPKEVDFVAVYVIPEDVWYLIPVKALRRRKRIRVCPSEPERMPRFEPYREAWFLLY